jgi:hypothetical protein
MSQHMVIFQTADGSPAYSQFESISEAVGFVESLRNDQGIENARMFELKEIKFELKPVYKVELKELTPGSGSSTPNSPASSAPSSAPAGNGPSQAPSQPAPSAPSSAPSSGDTTTFGGSFAPPSGGAPSSAPSSPSAPAPTPPADQPSSESQQQPTRRGLFGR